MLVGLYQRVTRMGYIMGCLHIPHLDHSSKGIDYESCDFNQIVSMTAINSGAQIVRYIN
jgi:hypothetical protein